MNYIELINHFWKLHEHWQFTCCEATLYFYLLKTANSLGWVDTFTHSDAKTAVNVGITLNTLKTARNRLMQAGLIELKVGGKGKGVKSRYQILTPKLIPKVQPKVRPKAEPNLEPKAIYTLYKDININETKGADAPAPPPDLKKFLVFEKWIEDHAPSVAKMHEPFTLQQYVELRAEYSNEHIKRRLLEMHNWKELQKKRVSAYLTFKQWANKV